MRVPNLGNSLVIVGLATLAGTFYMLHTTARRAARVETRALQVAQQLHNVSAEFEPLEIQSEADRAMVLERLRERCQSLGQPSSDLPQVVYAGATMTFGNKHYLFRVQRQPAPVRRPADWDPDALQPLEVYAWPRTLLPPGRSIFYFPANGPAAFSRNLSADYNGLDFAPEPGAGQPNEGEGLEPGQWNYRSLNEERWLLVPAAALRRRG